MSTDTLLGGLCQALADPRLQGIIGDFYALRDTVVVGDETPVRTAIAGLFAAIHAALHDRNELRKLTGEDDPSAPEVLAGLRAAEAFFEAEGFHDAVTALCLFRARLRLEDVASEADVLAELDGFLGLIGMGSVSVRALWEEFAADAAQRRQLWVAVTDVLYAVRDHCCYGALPPPLPPAPAASGTSVR